MSDSPDGYFAGLFAWSQEVRVALRGLDPTERRAIQMVYFERRTQQQVADELSLSRRTVSRAVSAGMQRLAVLMVARPAD